MVKTSCGRKFAVWKAEDLNQIPQQPLNNSMNLDKPHKFLGLSLLTQKEMDYSFPLNKQLAHCYSLLLTPLYAPIFSDQCSLITPLFFFFWIPK